MWTEFYQWLSDIEAKEVVSNFSKNRKTWESYEVTNRADERIECMSIFEVLERFEEYLEEKGKLIK